MTDHLIVRGALLGIACSVAFVFGIIFERYLSGEQSRIAAAVLQAKDLEEWFQEVGFVTAQTSIYEDLKASQLPQDVEKLKSKYRESALRSIANYERRVSEMTEERRRPMQRLLSEMSPEFKRRLDAAP